MAYRRGLVHVHVTVELDVVLDADVRADDGTGTDWDVEAAVDVRVDECRAGVALSARAGRYDARNGATIRRAWPTRLQRGFAGTPTAVAPDGTLFNAAAPEPTTAREPMVMPGLSVTPVPIITSRSTCT